MRTLIAMALLLVSASACGKKEESIDAEACEQLKAGPAVPVTAALGTVGAPAIAADHRRYDVTLVGSPGDKGGSVSFAAGMSGDFAFFMSADVHARFGDMGGMTISPESRTTNSPACSEIKTKYVVPLKVGSATLSFAYGPDDKVSVVVEDTAHTH
jgi:hypothetical protein